jgi:quercetin dioxygenase-like cupin family protein
MRAAAQQGPQIPASTERIKDMKQHTHFRGLAALFSLSLASATLVAYLPAQASEPHHTVVSSDMIAWSAAPPSLPPGAQAAVLLGNPAKEGPFVLRLKFPPGFTVPPHRHSKDEMLTVISGRLGVGSGEKLDRQPGNILPPASFVHLPAGMPHFAWADGETVVQINGVGPFDIKYVDPRDDPRGQ